MVWLNFTKNSKQFNLYILNDYEPKKKMAIEGN